MILKDKIKLGTDGVFHRAAGLLIDRDGVLRSAKGGGLIPGAREWVQNLADQKIPYLIATNHTTSSPEEGAEELRLLGFPVNDNQMHTPITILRQLYQDRSPGRVYARGTPELLDTLKSMNWNLVDHLPVDTVLMGFDQTMDYQALKTIISAAYEHGADLIALHKNHLYKCADGSIEPGLGAWVRAVEYATGSEALIIGKPSLEYYRTALSRLRVAASETVMISDDPLGDLVGAKQAGIHAIFVLTGKYPDPEIINTLDEALRPDQIVNSITELF